MRGIILAGALLLAGAAAGQGALPWSTADYEAEWKIAPHDHIVTMRYHAEGRRMRFEMNDPKQTAIIKDLASGQVLMLEGDGKAGVREARGQPFVLPPENPTGETRTAGGETCRVHEIGAGRICMSADGVFMGLEAGADRVEVLRVIRKPQNAALFTPPEGAPVTPWPGGVEGGTPLLPF